VIIKLRSLVKFLNDGDKTKITLRYRGAKWHREIGVDLLKRIEKIWKRSQSSSSFQNGRTSNGYGYGAEKEKIINTGAAARLYSSTG
jgi:translation initiation factor IF-3